MSTTKPGKISLWPDRRGNLITSVWLFPLTLRISARTWSSLDQKAGPALSANMCNLQEEGKPWDSGDWPGHCHMRPLFLRFLARTCPPLWGYPLAWHPFSTPLLWLPPTPGHHTHMLFPDPPRGASCTEVPGYSKTRSGRVQGFCHLVTSLLK